MKLIILTFVALLLVGSALGQVVTSSQGHKIMVFGGDDHKVYLGCLSCSEYTNDSVLNQFGPHGSEYRSESIFNRYGAYGSPYRSTSACNPYASNSPVIVDEQGNFYGHLTVNEYAYERSRNAVVNAWIKGVCASH